MKNGLSPSGEIQDQTKWRQQREQQSKVRPFRTASTSTTTAAGQPTQHPTVFTSKCESCSSELWPEVESEVVDDREDAD